MLGNCSLLAQNKSLSIQVQNNNTPLKIQQSNSELKEKDSVSHSMVAELYKDWYKLSNVKFSSNGKWSYFIKRYDNGRVEGVLENTRTKDLITYDSPSDVFLDDEIFILRNQKGILHVKSLLTKDEWQEEGIRMFDYYKEFNGILLLKEKELIWLDENSHLIKKYDNVEKVEKLETYDRVLVQRKDQLIQFNLSNTKEEILLNLSEEGQLIAIGTDVKHQETLFLLKKKDEYYLKIIGNTGEIKKNKNITELLKGYSQFSFSKNILIATRPSYLPQENPNDKIEEWNSDDQGLKPLIERYRRDQFDALLYDCQNNEIKITKAEEGVTRRFVVFENRYVLEILDLANEDFTHEHLIPKIQLRNLQNQRIEWEIDKTEDFFVFEKDQSIYYFNEGNWLKYDVFQKETSNLTKNLGEVFYYYSRQSTKYKHSIDRPILSHDMTKMYLTSLKNIWEYNIAEKQFINLTQNTDSQVHYKLQKFGNSKVEKLQWNDLQIQPNEELIIRKKTQDDFLEGLLVFRNGQLKVIEKMQGCSYENIVISDNGITYTFENANTPYQLKMYLWNPSSKGKNKSSVLLYQSNQKNYNQKSFPKTEVIMWNIEKESKHQRLNYASVVLPPNYTPNKKYPVIIHIYENKAKEYKDFVYPSMYNQQGMNRTLLAKEGYIIILPRIIYYLNEPGASALRAVNNAIEEVKKHYSIDENRMGIVGESFGGFETNYIITQTKKFKAAVSGVSIGDLTASYFSYNTNFMRPNIWRYTDQSYRLTGNFYELKNVFYDNNPVFHADNVDTPLLLWTGKEDYHVNWNQSLSMYIALAGLKKKVKLLLFPKEGHGLIIRTNQMSATQQIIKWWDEYLKK